MSRYPRYPPATVGVQRNPWISDGQPPLDCRESQSTNSSSSSRPPSLWLPHPHPERHPADVPASAAVTTAIVGGGTNTNLLVPTIVKQSSRPVTPASSPGTGVSGGAVDGCGGHCVAFENFCYYCLQVIFIAGILTGISLTIAGSVLRSQQRGGDLLVLVYIGCMIAMVCTLLLSVQCCVRRNVKRRKRALRAQRHRRSNAGPQHEAMIPMQDLQPVPQPPQQYQPLLVHLVQQQQQQQHQHQQQQVCTMEGHHRHAPIYRHHHSTYRSGADQLDMSQSGTPWWRRHHTVETRH